MAPREPDSWQESSASARERLRNIEKEIDRMRESIHELRGDAQAGRYLVERVAQLAGDVRELAGRLETVNRHAVQRPSPSGLAVLGQYLGVLVAIIALVVALTR